MIFIRNSSHCVIPPTYTVKSISKMVIPNGGRLCPQGTRGNVWRHFRWSQLGQGSHLMLALVGGGSFWCDSRGVRPLLCFLVQPEAPGSSCPPPASPNQPCLQGTPSAGNSSSRPEKKPLPTASFKASKDQKARAKFNHKGSSRSPWKLRMVGAREP